MIVTYKNKPFVYLAGPVEYGGDTWRERAGKFLLKLGFIPIDPLRNEKITKKGKHLESSISDEAIVGRNKYDLHRCRISGGFAIMNLSTTKDGRRPIGTLFELEWCAERDVPVVAILGKDCDPNIRTHPWIVSQVIYKATSVTDALNFIENYMV
ncbi:MAG: hypothetical protein QQN63_06545 [Nitrosopumilus sp.]